MQKVSLNSLFEGLKEKDNCVFLETKRFTPEDRHSYLFTEPVEIISCDAPEQVGPALKKTERLLKRGFFAAGFLSYEIGFALEPALKEQKEHTSPLLWFGIYRKPEVFDHRDMRFTDDKPRENYFLKDIKPDINENEYTDSVKKIKSYIEKGHTYQVNYTFKLDFLFSGRAFDLYRDLRRKQSVAYSSFIKFGQKHILSFSPELFFRKEKGLIRVKPMKGTSSRGRFLQEDSVRAKALSLCPKNRSENIMIVDLLRNDLGRISRKETVKTKKFFEVEAYESILQMTSTIEGRVNPRVSLYELFKALAPSGSVTGAPKIRTMQIIDELEKRPREVYTGNIGFLGPDGKGVFNVAIRTLLLDGQKQSGSMGIGSGIVYDSDPAKEYAECMLKADFLTKDYPDFKLIETLLCEKRRYPLIKFHMMRISESADYFGFSYNEKTFTKLLKDTASTLDREKRYRVRLLMDSEGNLDINYKDISEGEKQNVFISFSDKKFDSSEKFLFHKTTNRNIYDSEYIACKEKGLFDVIFKNEKGQITEGAITNIFIRKGNFYYTPPLECGLLNGVYRRYLMKSKTMPVREKILYERDIEEADEIFLTNAVRGMVRVQLSYPSKKRALKPAYA